MKITNEIANEIKKNYETIKAHNHIGLRGTQEDENYQVGDTTRNSLDWDTENDCSSSDELDGTSSVWVDNNQIEDADDLIERIEDAIEKVEAYAGKQIILIGGDCGDNGEDQDEIIIRDAVVLAIIK